MLYISIMWFDLFVKCSIRDITKEVAAAVVKEAIEEDLAEGYRDMDARELRKLSQVFIFLLWDSIHWYLDLHVGFSVKWSKPCKYLRNIIELSNLNAICDAGGNCYICEEQHVESCISNHGIQKGLNSFSISLWFHWSAMMVSVRSCKVFIL